MPAFARRPGVSLYRFSLVPSGCFISDVCILRLPETDMLTPLLKPDDQSSGGLEEIRQRPAFPSVLLNDLPAPTATAIGSDRRTDRRPWRALAPGGVTELPLPEQHFPARLTSFRLRPRGYGHPRPDRKSRGDRGWRRGREL
jgi:hypothetical protein